MNNINPFLNKLILQISLIWFDKANPNKANICKLIWICLQHYQAVIIRQKHLQKSYKKVVWIWIGFKNNYLRFWSTIEVVEIKSAMHTQNNNFYPKWKPFIFTNTVWQKRLQCNCYGIKFIKSVVCTLFMIMVVKNWKR